MMGGWWSVGTSPHTRGKPWEFDLKSWGERNIPAHAGKTAGIAWHAGMGEEHPRTRGENFGDSMSHSAKDGTSPHTRGKRHGDFGRIQGIRNIPAHAGKTMPMIFMFPFFSEHPRTRGENAY